MGSLIAHSVNKCGKGQTRIIQKDQNYWIMPDFDRKAELDATVDPFG